MVLETAINDYLIQLESNLPELTSSADLVKLGIFSSEAALCKARKSGNTPAFIKFSKGRIRYPRGSVITFLRERVNQGRNSSTNQQENENV